MPDNQQAQIAVLEERNDALEERIKSLELKVNRDEKTIAEFVSAARTGKWALGMLAAFGTLVAAIVTIVLSRSAST